VPSLVLVGLPGSGKSTVGRSLGRRLTVPFLRLRPLRSRERIGCSIREFFEREGEARFRDVEHEVLADLTLRPADAPSVIATGGGAVLREANRQLLRQGRTWSTCIPRPRRSGAGCATTPASAAAGERSAGPLRHLFAERAIRCIARSPHFVIETGRPSVPTLVNMVAMQLELAGVLPLR
jgi:shikimate kinase